MYLILYILILLILLFFLSDDKKLMEKLEKYKLFIIFIIVYLGFKNNDKYNYILLLIIILILISSDKIQKSDYKENINNYLKNIYLKIKNSVNKNYTEQFIENNKTEEYEEEKNIIIEENSNKYDQLKQKFNDLENKIKSML